MMKENRNNIHFANYAVGFVDLLGQRSLLQGQGLLPRSPDGSIPESFKQTAKQTIGAALDMHQACEMHLAAQKSLNQSTRNMLPPDQRVAYDKLKGSSLQYQRWSDGIVYFQSLAERKDEVPMNGVFGFTATMGMLCSLQLAKRAPIRGGIEIGWAVETRPGEIYGAALALAYELESKKAKWPRIVIGDNMLTYLKLAESSKPTTMFQDMNRKLANVILSWIDKDVDGLHHLHYLGDAYRRAAGSPRHNEVVASIRAYIADQLSHWQEQGNDELLARYRTLEQYFVRNS